MYGCINDVVCTQLVIWGTSIHSAAASDVTASSCAGYSAAAGPYWLRRVPDDAGRLSVRGAGSRGQSINQSINQSGIA